MCACTPLFAEQTTHALQQREALIVQLLAEVTPKVTDIKAKLARTLSVTEAHVQKVHALIDRCGGRLGQHWRDSTDEDLTCDITVEGIKQLHAELHTLCTFIGGVAQLWGQAVPSAVSDALRMLASTEGESKDYLDTIKAVSMFYIQKQSTC